MRKIFLIFIYLLISTLYVAFQPYPMYAQADCRGSRGTDLVYVINRADCELTNLLNCADRAFTQNPCYGGGSSGGNGGGSFSAGPPAQQPPPQSQPPREQTCVENPSQAKCQTNRPFIPPSTGSVNPETIPLPPAPAGPTQWSDCWDGSVRPRGYCPARPAAPAQQGSTNSQTGNPSQRINNTTRPGGRPAQPATARPVVVVTPPPFVCPQNQVRNKQCSTSTKSFIQCNTDPNNPEQFIDTINYNDPSCSHAIDTGGANTNNVLPSPYGSTNGNDNCKAFDVVADDKCSDPAKGKIQVYRWTTDTTQQPSDSSPVCGYKVIANCNGDTPDTTNLYRPGSTDAGTGQAPATAPGQTPPTSPTNCTKVVNSQCVGDGKKVVYVNCTTETSAEDQISTTENDPSCKCPQGSSDCNYSNIPPSDCNRFQNSFIPVGTCSDGYQYGTQVKLFPGSTDRVCSYGQENNNQCDTHGGLGTAYVEGQAPQAAPIVDPNPNADVPPQQSGTQQLEERSEQEQQLQRCSTGEVDDQHRFITTCQQPDGSSITYACPAQSYRIDNTCEEIKEPDATAPGQAAPQEPSPPSSWFGPQEPVTAPQDCPEGEALYTSPNGGTRCIRVGPGFRLANPDEVQPEPPSGQNVDDGSGSDWANSNDSNDGNSAGDQPALDSMGVKTQKLWWSSFWPF